MAVPSSLRVNSEIALLEKVVVHTPGEEMLLVSPENKDELLFDDILFAEAAQQEHEAMCRLIRTVVGNDDAVVQITGLIREAFQQEDARHEFVELLAERQPLVNISAYVRDLKKLDPDELHRFALTGVSPLKLRAQPSPNLMFTRDLSAVVGDHIILSHAMMPARVRESTLIHILVHHHPLFEDTRGKVIEIPPYVNFEGGDLLVVNEEVVLIGHSERTSLGGAMAVADALLQRTSVKHVLMVNLPKERYCMHLDTVFTFADETECVVFTPIMEKNHDNVFHLTRADNPSSDRHCFSIEIWPNLREPLEALTGKEFAFIQCGGDELIYQKREQWTDGANQFALAPGMIIGYERNKLTNNALKDHGYHIVDVESFLDYHDSDSIPTGQKIALQLTAPELSRGRGGPRCMTMPLRRTV